jgi:hypothetical protein
MCYSRNIKISRRISFISGAFRYFVIIPVKSDMTEFFPGHGLWYVFKISVKNAGGWSTEREVWLLMDAAKPTGPPLSFRVEPKTSTSVQLSWDLPEKWKRNGKIIGYELSYVQVGSSTKRKIESLDDKRLFELQGLKKFTSYQFRILAKTVAGDGPAVSIEGMTLEDGKISPPATTMS